MLQAIRQKTRELQEAADKILADLDRPAADGLLPMTQAETLVELDKLAGKLTKVQTRIGKAIPPEESRSEQPGRPRLAK